ncbi:MAG: putative secreted protein, partial [uncultured Blastococcus sp.]
ALVHRPPRRHRRLRYGGDRLREPLRAHPLDAAPVRRPRPRPGLGAADHPADLRPAHDRRPAVQAGVGGRPGRARAGPGHQHRRQPGRLRRRPRHAAGAGSADGPAGGLRAGQQRLLRPPAQEPAEVLLARPQTRARNRAAVAGPARRDAGPRLARPHQRRRRADRGRAADRLCRRRRLTPRSGPVRHGRGPGRSRRGPPPRAGPLPRAAGARPVRRRRLRPAALRAHARWPAADPVLRGAGHQLRHRPGPRALAAPLDPADAHPPGRHLAARLGGPGHEPLRPGALRLPARGDAAHAHRTGRL